MGEIMKTLTKKVIISSLFIVLAVTLVFSFAKCDIRTESGITTVSASANAVVNASVSTNYSQKTSSSKNQTHEQKITIGNSYTKIKLKKGDTYYFQINNVSKKDGLYDFTTFTSGAKLTASFELMKTRKSAFDNPGWQEISTRSIDKSKTKMTIKLNAGCYYFLGNPNWEVESFRMKIKATASTTLYIKFAEYKDIIQYNISDSAAMVWMPNKKYNPTSGCCNDTSYICKGIIYLSKSNAQAFGKMIGNKSFVQRMKQIYDYKVKNGILQKDANSVFLKAVESCSKSNAKTLKALTADVVGDVLSTLLEYLFADAKFAKQLNSISTTLQNAKQPMSIAFYSANPNAAWACVRGYQMKVQNLTYTTKKQKVGRRYKNVKYYNCYGEGCYHGYYEIVDLKK